jgi:hypothetical protein
MNARQMRIVSISMGLVLLIWLLGPLLLSKHESYLPGNSTLPGFNAKLALQNAREFTTKFPTRVLGSLESRPSTGYLHDALSALGYTTEYAHFDGRIGGRKQAGRNTLGYKQGASSEIIALVAHMDTAKPTRYGAMKNGAAAGALMELARVFSKDALQRSLLIVFSDGGEWGSLGAQDLSLNYPAKNRIAAVLSLDHVGVGNLRGFQLEETGQLKGFTPPWLRQLAEKAIETQNLPVASTSGFQEHLERALQISFSDQGPFLKAGIPAINLGSVSADTRLEKEVLHTPLDSIENIKLESVEKFGRAAEAIVRSIDHLQTIPRDSTDSLKLWKDRYLGSDALKALHSLALVPLLLSIVFYFKNHDALKNRILIGRELLAFTVTFIPFWVLYLCIRLLHTLRKLPLFSLYPATAKDPVMANPPWALLGGVLGASLFVAVAAYIICKYALQGWPKPLSAISKMVLLSLLFITVTLALFYNTFWALIFLTLPAWIWAFVESRETLGKRIRNGMLILAAAIPYFSVMWLFASQRGLGWNFLWYQVLAISNGLFSPAAYFLGALTITIGIRFFAIQKHS